MILKDINKNILFTITTLIVVSAVFIKYTYSAFQVVSDGNPTTLKFGDIEMTLCDTSTCEEGGTLYSNAIGTKTFTYHDNENNEVQATGYIPSYPTSDPYFKYYDSTWNDVDYYRFDIKNTGDLDLYASIYLKDDKLSSLLYTISHNTDTTYTKVDGEETTTATESGTNENAKVETYDNFVGTSNAEYKYFKVALIEDGATLPVVQTYENIVNNDYMVASQISLASGQTKTYYMYIWLSDDKSVDVTERSACETAISTCTDDTQACRTQIATACAAVKSNAVIGKYFVTDLYAKGEYKPAIKDEDFFVVEYNANGGYNAPAAQTKNKTENLTLSSATPKRVGYTFEGWNTAADGSGTSYTAGQTYTSDLSTKLYAQWSTNYIFFQLPPDWHGTSVCAKLYTAAQASDPSCGDNDYMELIDADRKIYAFDTSSYSNINTYSIVYFSNGVTIEEASGTNPRRAIAQNFLDGSNKAKLGYIFVPEIYSESGKTRVWGWATNFYFYLWKDSVNNGWPGQSGTVIGQRIHRLAFDTATYENMIVDNGQGRNQSANLLTPEYQDITYMLTSVNISGKKYQHLAYRLFYDGSWYDYDDYNISGYSTWRSNDYEDFVAAQSALHY